MHLILERVFGHFAGIFFTIPIPPEFSVPARRIPIWVVPHSRVPVTMTTGPRLARSGSRRGAESETHGSFEMTEAERAARLAEVRLDQSRSPCSRVESHGNRGIIATLCANTHDGQDPLNVRNDRSSVLGIVHG